MNQSSRALNLKLIYLFFSISVLCRKVRFGPKKKKEKSDAERGPSFFQTQTGSEPGLSCWQPGSPAPEKGIFSEIRGQVVAVEDSSSLQFVGGLLPEAELSYVTLAVACAGKDTVFGPLNAMEAALRSCLVKVGVTR